MIISLEKKYALVAGSTQGIGLATAQELANAGCSITLIARNEEKLRLALKSLNTSKGQAHKYVVADFSDIDNLKNAIKFHMADGNEYQILVNNSGGPAPGPAHKAELSEYTSAFQQHLLGNHILAQACIEGMKKANYGRIINVISTSVKQPLNNLGVSNTVRGAVANWAKTMANELGQYGITVNNVLPGATATGRLDSIIANKAKKLEISEEEAAEKMKADVPANRFAQPEELAYAITFLASDKASYINGINVPVDGGRTGSL